MQSLRGILNFTRTAELGSFAAAAKDFGISAVAVSQNIGRLEEALGVRLFARSTRALKLTAEGQMFLDQCKGPLAQLDAACKAVSTDSREPAGKLRVTAVSPFATQYLLPALPKFFKSYPEIELDLELSEDVSPLIAKGFEVGIRVGVLNDAAFVARPIGPIKLLLCASPAYLEVHRIPKTVESLEAHENLLLQITGQEKPTPFYLMNRLDGSRSLQMLMPRARMLCNDFRSLQVACENGLGIAQLPQPVVLPALKAGKLKVLLSAYQVEGWQLYIHYPSRRQVPARVRAFVDFCINQFAGHPDLSADIQSFVAK